MAKFGEKFFLSQENSMVPLVQISKFETPCPPTQPSTYQPSAFLSLAHTHTLTHTLTHTHTLTPPSPPPTQHTLSS